MKKLSILLILILVLAACGENTVEEPGQETSGEGSTTNETGSEEAVSEEAVLDVYTTVYPLSYFTERIGGERVNVNSIYPAGANEHTFEPTQQDMISMAEADILFYIGLGLEGFIDSAKNSLSGENVEFIATADYISDEELEAASSHGFEEEAHDDHSDEEGHDDHASEGDSHDDHSDEEGHDDHASDGDSHDDHSDEEGHDDHASDGESHDGHDHGSTDPHVWISPVLSQNLAASIKDSLVEADPDGAEQYEANYEELISELELLDQSFSDLSESADNRTFFVSHAAFGYIADTYGFNQVAVAGLNSQDEPSQKELTEIVDLAREKNIEYIVFEQNVSSNLTEVVQKEVGAEAVQMHNLGVLTQEDIDNGETYFTLMEKNLETLETILK